MSFNIENLDDVHLDVLTEIGNIGAGNAATSLSIMVNKPIDMNVPQLNIIKFNEVESILGGAEKQVTGIYLEFYGDVTGTIMFVLDAASTVNLLALLLNKHRQEEQIIELDEIELSALKEVANILTGSFITALSDMTGLSIKHTIPELSIDMAGAILSVPLIVFGQQGDRALFIETNFSEGMDKVTGHFYLIPNLDSYVILLESLGVA